MTAATRPSSSSPPLSLLLEHSADAVQAVRAGRSLNDALAQTPAALRPGVQALSFHTLRWLGAAEALRVHLAPKTPPPAVDALLLVCLALLWPGETPPYPEHTLVDQAVTAARQRNPAAAKFINAVLRRFVRERDTLVPAALTHAVAEFNHPAWWIARLQRDWPEDWRVLLEQANLRPPMTLRVNTRQGSTDDYLGRLQASGHGATSVSGLGGLAQAVVLAAPCAVQALPGFADGAVSVQDAAAQRAAPLLLSGGSTGTTLPAGAHVLDACAAPGGKTAHLLELADLDMVALDSDAQRLERVQDTLARLRLPSSAARVKVCAGDARRADEWWDQRPFDAILLDAPCTASGIVRRHPDVRWLRRDKDVAALAKIQRELLDALWPLLKPGGRLLYATCSLFKAEGQDQIDAFLQRLPQGAARLAPDSPGHLLPSRDNGGLAPHAGDPALQDAFFYALIFKT